MKSQKVAYGKRVTSLPTIPEISPTKNILGKTDTLPLEKWPYGSNCLLKTKLLHLLQEKNHVLILTHTGCSQALSRYYTQCKKNLSIRVATRLFIKPKAPSHTFGTVLLPGCNFSRAKFTRRTMRIKRSQMCFKHSIGLHTFAGARQGRPACVCAFRAQLISTRHPRCAGQWKNVKLKKPCRYLAHSGAVLKPCQKDLRMIYQRNTLAKAKNQTLLPC